MPALQTNPSQSLSGKDWVWIWASLFSYTRRRQEMYGMPQVLPLRRNPTNISYWNVAGLLLEAKRLWSHSTWLRMPRASCLGCCGALLIAFVISSWLHSLWLFTYHLLFISFIYKIFLCYSHMCFFLKRVARLHLFGFYGVIVLYPNSVYRWSQ